MSAWKAQSYISICVNNLAMMLSHEFYNWCYLYAYRTKFAHDVMSKFGPYMHTDIGTIISVYRYMHTDIGTIISVYRYMHTDIGTIISVYRYMHTDIFIATIISDQYDIYL